MRAFFTTSASAVAIMSVFIAGTNQSVHAQTVEEDPQFQEEIVVTGSRIRRPSQATTATPLDQVGQEDIAAIGAATTADIIQTLTINTGSQNTPDQFTQSFSAGTANMNLRGLGVSSTLVLLNGRRQVLSGATTNRGNNFVDTNSLVPLIAVERVEIFKDGAAAVYGTDAVAGVVNFLTRSDFEGVEVTGQYENIEAGAAGYRLEGLWGVQNDRGGVVISGSFFDRSELSAEERLLPGSEIADISSVGQPGTFFVPTTPTIDPNLAAIWTGAFDNFAFAPGQNPAFNPAVPATYFVPGSDNLADALTGSILQSVGMLPPGFPAPAFNFTDPDQDGQPEISQPAIADQTCSTVAELDDRIIPPPSPAPGVPAGIVGTCNFFFGEANSLSPNETRWQGFGEGTYDVTDWATLYAEVGFANFDVSRTASPSFPVTTTTPLAANNPFNQYNQDVNLLARSQAAGTPPNITNFESETVRFSLGVEGDFTFLDAGFLQDWTYDLSYVFGRNEYGVEQRDVIESRWFDSVAGFGGTNCNAAAGLPGQNGCQFFNPTGTSFLAEQGLAPATTPFETTDAQGNPTTIQVPTANSDAITDFIFGTLTIDSVSELETFEAVFQGELPIASPFAARSLALAVGTQYRNSYFENRYDDIGKQLDYLFLVGGSDFAESQDVIAAFAELEVPLADWFVLNGAVRFEDYGGGVGDTIDPKASLLFGVSEMLQDQGMDFIPGTFSLRASAGTSFRAPSVFQRFGTQTTLEEINNPITGATAFLAVRTLGDPNLQPEEAFTVNAGLSWEPIENFNIDIDYWRFDFEEIIIQENAQAIVNQDAADGSYDNPAIQVNPETLSIELINSQFANASSLKTDGIDAQLRWTIDSGRFGIFQPSFESTYILSYELEDPQLGTIDGVDSRNFTNFGTSTPDWRFNAGLAWTYDRVFMNLFARYIDSYDDDQVRNGVENGTVDSHLTLDVQAGIELPNPLIAGMEGPRLTVGANNVTDELPPTVLTNGGFDSRVHDPRGRIVYARISQTF
jgi:iron complex outermembrane receptor protein